MSFHYKGNIAWSSLPGITSFHNLMYITHNRVYHGGRGRESGRETARGVRRGGASGEGAAAGGSAHTTNVCIEGLVSAKSALAGARS